MLVTLASMKIGSQKIKVQTRIPTRKKPNSPPPNNDIAAINTAPEDMNLSAEKTLYIFHAWFGATFRTSISCLQRPHL